MTVSSFEERIAVLHAQVATLSSASGSGSGSPVKAAGVDSPPAKGSASAPPETPSGRKQQQQHPPQTPFTPMGGSGGTATNAAAHGSKSQAELFAELEELQDEHDDLLALLSQQELEKNAIRDKLLEVAGQEAYDAARKVAERQCLSRFGLFVPVSSAVFSFAIIYLK